MEFTIAGLLISKFHQRKSSAISAIPNSRDTEISKLQRLQQRILQLRWKNFARVIPSISLANNLNNMYDQTVAQLEHQCGSVAHVADVDLEKWDLYYESLEIEDRIPENLNVTKKMAMERISKKVGE